jgi:phenylalanyl-tRNA synthetase beta subunit
MNINEYEELRHFMACYFDQDFDLDSTDPDEIVKIYFDDDGVSKEFDLALDQLHKLNESNYDDETLGVILLKLGCYYQPKADGWTFVTWLKHVEDLLRSLASGST